MQHYHIQLVVKMVAIEADEEEGQGGDRGDGQLEVAAPRQQGGCLVDLRGLRSRQCAQVRAAALHKHAQHAAISLRENVRSCGSPLPTSGKRASTG